MREDETVCAAPARVLNSEEQSDHEKGGHVRKVGNCVPCAAGCGRMRSHFRLDPTTRPGGCFSVDISGPHVPGVWPAPDDSQFVVTREGSYFLVAHYQTYTPEEVNTILSREREAVELAEHECDHGGPREEEPAESDFFSDEIVADESDDHPVGSFWIYAHPLASKKAAEVLTAIQTIVGRVSRRCYWKNSFRSCQQTSRRLRLGDQWRKGKRVGKDQRFQGDIDCRRRSVKQFSC